VSKKNSDVCFISLAGDLSVDFVHQFKDLASFSAKFSKDITLDLEQVEHIDSNGLGFLLALKQHLIKHDHKLIIKHPSQEVLKQFKRTALDYTFEIQL
jgi:anti-anti-sigma factor